MKLNYRLEPSLQTKSSYDYKLEGLRGFAAVSVASYHVFGLTNFLDPTYHPHIYWSYLQAAHSAVLLFFVLSGYVIGLTTTDFSIQKIGNYFIRRGVRLLPIYFVAVCFGLIIRPNEQLTTILGNFLFLQNFDNYFSWTIPPITGNKPVWSLNYELLYYLVFILIWWLSPKVSTLFLWTFVVSVVGWFIPSFPQFISGYASGWIFWLSGLWLSWKVLPSAKKPHSFPLLSYILLFHATNHLLPGKIILNGFGFPNSVASFVNLSDIAILPICILLIAEITKRYFYGLKWLRLLCFIIPVANLFLILATKHLSAEPRWISSFIFTITAIISINYKFSGDILKYLAPFGRISYAFYLLHIPMMYLMHDYFPWQGKAWSFSIGLLVWFLLTAALSSLLELVVQPAIKRWFHHKIVLKGA